MTRKNEDNVAYFGKVDLFGSSRASTSKVEVKPTPDMMVNIIEGMEKMTTNMQSMGNQMIRMEREQNQMHLRSNFWPCGNFIFYRNKRIEDTRLPIPLEPTNVVEDEDPRCRPSNDPHFESTCRVYRSLVMSTESTQNEGNLDRINDVNYMDDGFYLCFG